MTSNKDRTYLAIDLKSFFASVECVERGLDPLTTNLVVADPTRTDKTICLAVSPSLKSYGLAGRARLFEVNRKVSEVNSLRRRNAPRRVFRGKSFNNTALLSDPSLELDFIVAPPQMSHYMKVSGQVYATYLKYVAPEDMHVYSVDEVFIDVTDYLGTYGCTAHELAIRMIRDVLATTGITATAGIGTNMYLAKVAMDIEAKHLKADADGVRIAEFDEISYRKSLWNHTPLTDFWRVGKGIAARLNAVGINTMGDLAQASLKPQWEAYLYKQFGVNAELLIDHAWGWEPCTISQVKMYRPETNSKGNGQVLQRPYPFDQGRVVALEMADNLSLDLVSRGLITNQVSLWVNYDSISGGGFAHASASLGDPTSSTEAITSAVGKLYDRIVDRKLFLRRLNVTACDVVREKACVEEPTLDLFGERKSSQKERKRQEAILSIKRKFGKNAILKGRDFEEGATTRERNNQIGGHKA